MICCPPGYRRIRIGYDVFPSVSDTRTAAAAILKMSLNRLKGYHQAGVLSFAAYKNAIPRGSEINSLSRGIVISYHSSEKRSALYTPLSSSRLKAACTMGIFLLKVLQKIDGLVHVGKAKVGLLFRQSVGAHLGVSNSALTE